MCLLAAYRITISIDIKIMFSLKPHTAHAHTTYNILTQRCTAQCILQQSPVLHGRCPPTEDPTSSKLLPSFEVLPCLPWRPALCQRPALRWPCWSPVFQGSAALQWYNIKHSLWATDTCLLTAHKMACKSPHTVKPFPSKQTCGALHTSPPKPGHTASYTQH